MEGEIKYRNIDTTIYESKRSLNDLLIDALNEKDESYLVGIMLELTQAYSNKLMKDPCKNREIGKPTRNNTPPAPEKSTLEELLSLDEALIADFRLGKKMDTGKFKKGLRDVCVRITAQSNLDATGNNPIQVRYLEFVGRDAGNNPGGILNTSCMKVFYTNLKEKLKDTNVDTIIYLANGALEAACIAKAVKTSAELIPVRYSHYRKHDAAPRIPSYMSLEDLQRAVKGKSVLIIDDDIDTGRSMAMIITEMRRFEPKELYFGAAYTYGLNKMRGGELSRWLFSISHASTEIFHVPIKTEIPDDILLPSAFKQVYFKGPGLFKYR